MADQGSCRSWSINGGIGILEAFAVWNGSGSVVIAAGRSISCNAWLYSWRPNRWVASSMICFAVSSQEHRSWSERRRARKAGSRGVSGSKVGERLRTLSGLSLLVASSSCIACSVGVSSSSSTSISLRSLFPGCFRASSSFSSSRAGWRRGLELGDSNTKACRLSVIPRGGGEGGGGGDTDRTEYEGARAVEIGDTEGA